MPKHKLSKNVSLEKLRWVVQKIVTEIHYMLSNFMFKPCIDMTSLNNNQLMHSQFNIYYKHIKSSFKFTPTRFGSQVEPSSGGQHLILIQDGSNMTGTDLCVNKPHCAAAVRPWESEATTSTLPPPRVRTCSVLSGSC